MGLGYAGFHGWGIDFYLCLLKHPFTEGRNSPLPTGRGVGGEGLQAQKLVARCSEGLLNSPLNFVSESPHPRPLSQWGEGRAPHSWGIGACADVSRRD